MLVVFAALVGCESKQEAPAPAQAQPAALTKTVEAPADPPKSHIRLENVKTLVPLKKMDPKQLKSPTQVPRENAEEANESKAP